VSAQVAADVFGTARGVGGPDRLVSVLGARPCLLLPAGTQVLVSEARADPVAGPLVGLVGDAGRVGPHVGDEPGRPFVAQLDALVEILSQAHRPLGRETEAAG